MTTTTRRNITMAVMLVIAIASMLVGAVQDVELIAALILVTLTLEAIVYYGVSAQEEIEQLAKRTDSLEHTISKGYEDRSRAGRLSKAFEDTDLFDEELMVKFAEKAAEFDESSPRPSFVMELVADIVNKKLSVYQQDLHECAHGRFVQEGEAHSQLLQLTDGAQSSISATSLTTIDNRFWSTQPGEEYLRRLVKRAETLEVRRVFIHTAESEEIAWKQARHQAEAGLEVRIVAADDLPSHERVDFIVFDEALVYRVQISDAGDLFRTELSIGNGTIQESRSRFENVWTQAKPVEVDK